MKNLTRLLIYIENKKIMKYLNKRCIESTGHVNQFTRWGDLKKRPF